MVKNNKPLWLIGLILIEIVLAVSVVFNGCTFGNMDAVATSDMNKNPVSRKKDWTFMVYMAADNNLEAAALEDFNEMEASDFDSEKINVIVLFDRNNFKDSNDLEEWRGARMYEICKDKNGINNTICSKRISCSDLGLGIKNEKSLDMGNPETLRGFVKNVVNYYPAEHYGIFVWGHGTGYRNSSLQKNETRAVAVDDSSDSFMENCVVASSIKNGMGDKKIDLLAYDTCFAAELEVVYEFSEVAEYFIGSQGIQVESGLDYRKVFTNEIGETENGLSAAKCVAEKLSDNMKKDFSIINLSEIKNLFSSFDSFASSAASFVSSKTDGVEIRNEILSKAESFRSFESSNNPVYVNILSLADMFVKKYQNLVSYKNNLETAIKKSVVFYSGANKNLPLGIYFCSVDNSNALIMDFSPYYCKGKNLKNQCSFVKDSSAYVLTVEKNGTLLDRLFENYNF